jgi:hypothetical protein
MIFGFKTVTKKDFHGENSIFFSQKLDFVLIIFLSNKLVQKSFSSTNPVLFIFINKNRAKQKSLTSDYFEFSENFTKFFAFREWNI